MDVINKNHIVRVKVYDFYKSDMYFYEKEKYSWTGFKRKEGFYMDFFGEEYIGTEVPDGHIFKDGVVYEKPEVVIKLVTGETKRKTFESYKEAKQFALSICKDSEFLEL